MKNQKGITLIALVITIIVLLILAGVAIAMLSGDNGILNKASDSKVKTAIGAGKEAVSMAVNEGVAAYYEAVYVNSDTSTYANQAAAIKAKMPTAAAKDEAYIIEVTPDVEDNPTQYTIKVSYYENNAASTTVYSTATMSLKGEISAWTDTGL